MSGSGVVVRVVVSALVAAVVGTAASAAAAEPEPAPIEVGALTSRPGVGDTAQAMPLGAIIVNPGLTVSGPPVSVGAPSPSTAPDILVRVGIAHGVEARGAVSFDAVGKSVVMSPSFALAGQLLTESDFVPAMLGIVTLSLPTAADPTALGGELRISEAKGFGQFGIGSNAALSVEATGAAPWRGLSERLSDWAPGMWGFHQRGAQFRGTLTMARARLEGMDVKAAERHLAQNGALVCESFLEAFQAKSRAFLAFLTAFGCLLLVLAVRLGLAVAPAGRRAE